MEMNQKLTKLYQSEWDDLILNSKSTDATYPLLIKVGKEYQDADIRIIIVGQETDGWCGILEENKKSIIDAQNTYFNYFYKSKDKNRRPFWNRKNFKYFQEQLSEKLSPKKVAFIWNNISKIGKNSRGKPTKIIENLEKNNFNVFEEELNILQPHIIIFTIGNRAIPLQHKKYKLYEDRYIFEVKLTNYPHIIAVSTYHPNARIKGGKKEIKKDIVNFIVQRYNKTLERNSLP